MRPELMDSNRVPAGFNFSERMRWLCTDMTTRLPALAHIDMRRVVVAVNPARKGGVYGIHASLTPLRFENGSREGVRRGRRYAMQRVLGESGEEMLYILRFYLPRFMEVDLVEKLVTVVHELWHVSPDFNGDPRRHEGRCHVHTGSQKHYDAAMEELVQQWLLREPPEELFGFLQLNFAELGAHFGNIYGVRIAQPKLIPLPAGARPVA